MAKLWWFLILIIKHLTLFFGEILAKFWRKFGESLGKLGEEMEKKNIMEGKKIKKHFVKPKHFYTFVLNFKTK